MSDRELAEQVGFQIERKWQIVLARDGRWFSRTTAGWFQSQGRGDESAKSLEGAQEGRQPETESGT